MADIVELQIKITRSALGLLVSCANIGVEGAEGNLADIDDVTDLLDQLEGIAESPNDLFIIDQQGDFPANTGEAHGKGYRFDGDRAALRAAINKAHGTSLDMLKD